MESTQVALHGRIVAIRQSCFINNSAVIVTHQDVIKGGEYSLHILTCMHVKKTGMYTSFLINPGGQDLVLLLEPFLHARPETGVQSTRPPPPIIINLSMLDIAYHNR